MSSGLSGARERAVEALCDHFSRDALELDELERRLDGVHQAATEEDLRSLLSDLPGGADVLDQTGPTSASSTEEGEGRIPESAAPSRRTVVAVCGGNSRRGRWVPARKTLGVALCGGVELDFREARLPPGVTEVTALAVMGGVDVVVPPGTYVESEGLALLGGFENVDEHAVELGSDDPVIRVRGFAVMGAVQISVRHPGESPREARRRVREARKRRRRRLGDG